MNDTANIPHFVMLSNDCAVIKPLADGKESPDLLSQEEAIEFLGSAIKRGMIDPADRVRVTKEITSSDLRKALSLQERVALDALDILKDIYEILDQEFGPPRDSFSSKNDVRTTDSMRVPGNQTIH